MPVAETNITTRFFDLVFDGDEGYICIAIQDPRKGKEDFRQAFFRWPQQRKDLVTYVEQSRSRHNVWFCVNLLEEGTRQKEYCLRTNLVWSDLDEIDPETIDLKPPIVIESSPGRYQALWRLNEKVEPEIAEDYSRRLAYSLGADKSGWDLTQLLRVPLTFNYKYEIEGEDVPVVQLKRGLNIEAPIELFETLPKPPQATDPVLDEDVPEIETLPNPNSVIYKYWANLKSTAFAQLHENIPEHDWSGNLWREINILLEAGMDKDEVFAIVRESACNKYARDNRPERYLWRDVVKASAQQSRIPYVVGEGYKPLAVPEIAEKSEVLQDTFIAQYCEWAKNQTDAIEEYHELVAFLLLSTVLSAGIKLETSYGMVAPNLWGMILGESTLTRKSTAMDMGANIINQIDPDLILATDGSAEGVLTGLSGRSGKVSLFYRDEVSGFFDAINRKDYLAGMPETLTKLYDCPPLYTRRLRKEIISISNPFFIFFGGGIRERVYELLTQEYVYSGFLPRFLIVSGDTDTSRYMPTKPATRTSTSEREKVIKTLTALYKKYTQKAEIKVAGQTMEVQKSTEVTLSDEAWDRYEHVEKAMIDVAVNSPVSEIALPTFDRLTRSVLKMAILLAGSREQQVVEERDIATAAYYIQNWGRHSVDLIMSVGKSSSEKSLNKIFEAIVRGPGVLRSTIARNYHLTKKQMDMIVETLEDRNQIKLIKRGKATELWPL